MTNENGEYESEGHFKPSDYAGQARHYTKPYQNETKQEEVLKTKDITIKKKDKQ